MKTEFVSLTMLACLFLVGCDEREGENETPVQATDPTVSDPTLYERTRSTLDETGEGLQGSWDQVSEYAADQKDAFVSNLEQGMDEVDDWVADSRRELDGMSDEAREAKESALEEVEEARGELEAALKNARQATAESWAAAKAEVAEAWRKLQGAVSDAEENPEEGDYYPAPAPPP